MRVHAGGAAPAQAVREMSPQLGKLRVVGISLRYGRDELSPFQGRPLACIEERRLAPAGHAVEPASLFATLDEIAPVHVDAERAAVDLRDAKKYQIDERVS
jgi:hypothetical protein